jgi:hypothetical protein
MGVRASEDFDRRRLAPLEPRWVQAQRGSRRVLLIGNAKPSGMTPITVYVVAPSWSGRPTTSAAPAKSILPQTIPDHDDGAWCARAFVVVV